MSRWKAEYFEKPGAAAPSRSEILESENEPDALYEMRGKMGSSCSRAELSRLDPKSVIQSLA
jgi:hypothetical protein